MSKNLFILGSETDPYFNIASEEYLLKQRQENFIYLWVNSPAVIVGVNQNTAEEVKLDYAEENGIKVVRRMTGGGAVYHDENNVCYTIISSYDGQRDNYRYFTQSILNYLNGLGVKAEFSGRNDLTVDGKKFSGNAQCVYKNRIMHHGTLLFDTDKTVLENVLKPHELKVQSKGVKSVRARVTNLKEHLPNLSCSQFTQGLAETYRVGAEEYFFTKEDIFAINALVKNKYSTHAWNVGASPKCEISAQKKFPFGIVKVDFDLSEGALANVNVSGDFFSLEDKSALNRALNGVLYKKEDVVKALFGVEKYVLGASAEQIAELFFN